MAALPVSPGGSRILLRVLALLSGVAVAGVPVAHSLTEVPGSGPRYEAEHTAACQVAHGAEMCAAAAGVLIARPTAGPVVRPSSPVDRERRTDAPLTLPSAPSIYAAGARAPPTL